MTSGSVYAIIVRPISCDSCTVAAEILGALNVEKRSMFERAGSPLLWLERRKQRELPEVFPDRNASPVLLVLTEGSALSPFLFVLVMDMLSEAVRNEELWELLYSEDLVNTAENEEDLKRRVGAWQESLEIGGLKVNVNKTGFAELLDKVSNVDATDEISPNPSGVSETRTCESSRVKSDESYDSSHFESAPFSLTESESQNQAQQGLDGSKRSR
ncbi:uncharacterized protein LOC135208291 [Macrobrachium nipponense]|uniref:uncharacterized protein LOC135208291 n=1 Tax=Macrobrachium nipponense TaxID=159736 RepID=UPI0030C876DA